MTKPIHKGLALAILGISQLMIVLDASIVNVALPAVSAELKFSSSDLQWIVTAYTLTFGGFLLLGGRIADRMGRKRVFMVGLIAFIVASTIGGFAENSLMLVIARGLQGLGGALMAPSALSLPTVIFKEGEERNKALGVWGGIAAGGGAIGVLTGGVLVEYLDWRWCLWVNIPIGLAAVVAAWKFLPESHDAHAKGFDAPGAVMVTAGLMALVYGLTQGNELGWTSSTTIGMFIASVVLLAAFYVRQTKVENPLVNLRLFENRTVMGADLTGLLVGSGIFGMFFYMSLYLQQILGYSPIKTGLAFLPITFFIGISAGITSNTLIKVGARKFATIGLITASIGMLAFIRINPDGDYWTTVFIPFGIVGLGMGMTFVSITAAALAGVPERDSGLASAVLNTGQQIGGALGLAVLTAVSASRIDDIAADVNDSAAVAAATTSGWAWGFFVAACLLAVGALIANRLIRVSAEEAAEAAKHAVAAG